MAVYVCGRCGATVHGCPFQLTCGACDELLIHARKRRDQGE